MGSRDMNPRISPRSSTIPRYKLNNSPNLHTSVDLVYTIPR